MKRLHHHPSTPEPAVHSLVAEASRLADGSLRFVYELRGELTALQIASSRDNSRCDGLWRHTCFEAFIAVADEITYREFNFSPSGQWAAYAFTAYRQAENSILQLASPRIAPNISADGFTLSAHLAPDALPPNSHLQTLRVGLCAVIENAKSLSYWALHHATERPDFHHPGSFILPLP